MRIAFLGTPPFAARLLAELAADGFEIAAVYTQPNRPRGRGQSLQPTPVARAADALGLELRSPASLKTDEEAARFGALRLDAAVVVAYGQVLTPKILSAPRLGCFNVHASLLPRWRGAAPIQRAVMAGDTVTGVQVMRMTAGLDEGPVLATARVGVDGDDTAGSLHDRLLEAAVELLPATLRDIEAGRAVETHQLEAGATYARKISAKEARIVWSRPAVEIDRLIRGLSPAPGAWFEIVGAQGPVRVKALASRLGRGDGEPGDLLDDELLIACGQGAVRLLRVQREGRTAQTASQFLNGLTNGVELKLL
jgi:methionyl-tRNA formyltransferase